MPGHRRRASSITSRPTGRSSPTAAAFRLPGPADRSLRQGPGRRFPARPTTASSGRPSAWWSTTSSTGKATATCAAACPRRSSTRCTSAASPSRHVSGVKHPGTYLGVIEKIPYLQSLGVTAVELMPVHEFPVHDCLGQQAGASRTTGATIRWPFSPRTAATRSGTEPGCQVREFKEMVRALHRAGIEVILDVVFNHTAEGNEHGPDAELQGAGEPRLLHAGERRPLLPQLLRLRQHAQRQPPHRPRADLPLPAPLGPQLPRRRLPLRPGLDPQPRPRRRTWCPTRRWSRRSPRTRCWPTRKIIAEAWDAAGAYQVGTFASLPLGRVERPLPRRRAPLLAGRSATWSAPLATRLAGSSDLYQPSGRQPYHSINFITSPRRLHAQRPGALQPQAQRGQRRRQSRRREQQLQLQLRRRRAHRNAASSRPCACGRSRTCWRRCCSARACP